jgi:hypothetical protein
MRWLSQFSCLCAGIAKAKRWLENDGWLGSDGWDLLAAGLLWRA